MPLEKARAEVVDEGGASGLVWTAIVAVGLILLMVVMIRVAWAAVKLVWIVIPVLVALFVVGAIMRHRSRRGRVSASARP